MAEPAIDKKLEGRLFDLLEERARIRLGDLVLLRRRSRERGVSLLHTALEAGRLPPMLARELADEAGMADPTDDPEPSDDSLSDSMLDSMVDAPPEPLRRRARPRDDRRDERERPETPSPSLPPLRAPGVADRGSRNSMPEAGSSAPPPPRSAPPRPPVIAPAAPPDAPGRPPALRAPPAANWLADRPTVKMDEPPPRQAPRVIDRIAAPRREVRREDQAPSDERVTARPGIDERVGARPAAPRVVGDLRPLRRTPPVPDASAPGQSAPGQAAPGQAAGQSATGQATPGQPAPGQATPGQAAPGQSTPAQSAQTQSAPAQPAPAQSSMIPGLPPSGGASPLAALMGIPASAPVAVPGTAPMGMHGAVLGSNPLTAPMPAPVPGSPSGSLSGSVSGSLPGSVSGSWSGPLPGLPSSAGPQPTGAQQSAPQPNAPQANGPQGNALPRPLSAPLPPLPAPGPALALPVAAVVRQNGPPPLPGVVAPAVARDTVPAIDPVVVLAEDDFEDEWGDTAPPTGAAPGEAEDEGLVELPAGPDRYALGDEIGRGGMGQILEARDLALDRPVALKLLHDADQADPALRMRFIDEARVTGQLQHPSVPPVYDLGRLGDGRLFFAMKRIEGRTLRDIVEELAEGHGATMRDFGRVRLLTIFGRVCRAIAYAHSRGVMHRDLKPDNIMLGEFGEVTVMDWGLAKPFGVVEAVGEVSVDAQSASASGIRVEASPIATTREGSGRFQTRSGEVTGTPQYMSPEQAAGQVESLGAHSDIYSLGAVLYELLTLGPPFDGQNSRAVRDAVMHEQIVPPSVRSPERDIPHPIEQLCLQCLSRDPRNRPKTAGEVADRIDRFLEGEQDRARKESERERLLEAGTRAAEAYYTCYEQHKQLQAKTAKMRTRVAPWAPSAERSRLWAQEDAEIHARVKAARSLSEAMVAYHAALELDRDHPAARRALAALYYSAFEAAERDDDRVQMALYEHLVRAFDDDEHTFSTRLKGDGRLELVTLPAGLAATLYTHTSVERVLKPITPKNLGQTPVVIDPMPMGSYLLKLQGPGLSPTVVPIAITRQKRLRLRLRMFPDRLREPDEIHIVGGPTRLGGDPLAQLARPARTVEVDDFFLARRPVTAQAYREFLHHLAQTMSPSAAAARAPRDTPSGHPLWMMDDIGRFTLPAEDLHGVAWHPDWPVVGISCEDAEAYCAWLDETRGPGHRLPTEIEWEKAARGADGRLFPWGDTWEPTFCHIGISRPGPPARGPSGVFATDISPYGIEDLAGGVSEWTSTWLDGAEQRVIKGGHWASGPTECRAASRFTQPIDRVLPTLGFRVARSAPA